LGEAAGDEDGAAEEIDAGGCGWVLRWQFDSAREGGDLGREILEQVTRAAMGGARSSKRWSPATRSAGWPAMARRPGFTVAALVERVWEARESAKGAIQRL
jgi:hypothetical protein